MSSFLVLIVILLYFGLILVISQLTGRHADNASFFIGNRKSPWYIVAFGMIGASLSGVTFISVPGWVGGSHFHYMQVVMGYMIGYAVIAFVLMPIYYRMNLTSIYGYLDQRFGFYSYKTGAVFFLFSRIVGASFRLYLVAMVLQQFIIGPWAEGTVIADHSFELTVLVSILLIWIYTFRGGIRTIIWTDTLQTFFMLLAVGVAILLIAQELDLGFGDLIDTVAASSYSDLFQFRDWKAGDHFLKHLVGGAFIAIAMTGLDQDMMQKNLSCRNIGDAQKNMVSFSIVLFFVNLVFLALGALLFIFAETKGMAVPDKTDQLFPLIALDGGLGLTVGIFFILGLVAAAYSSADSALTALTTSVCVDIIDIKDLPEEQQEIKRKRVHITMSVILFFVIVAMGRLITASVVDELLRFAGYTYGPLLGMYAFGILTRKAAWDKAVPMICVLSPILTYILYSNSATWFNGYQLGYELLVVNGLLAFVGLYFSGLLKAKLRA